MSAVASVGRTADPDPVGRPSLAIESLVLDHVSKSYASHVAVQDVSLAVKRGEFLTLLGPSGSGKTTLLMMVAGFIDPDSGDISLAGRRLNQTPPERRNFGMVFQGYALFPHLSVFDNVAFSMVVRRCPKAEIAAKVRSALEMVQLSHLADRLPRQLSGGQQQRVALARAIAFSPELVLLDEPMSALDKQLRSELQQELRDLHDRLGLTFICVTHDQDEALSMSDQVAILRDGRLVQIGSPADLYHRPRTRFAASFLGTSNFICGNVVSSTAEGFSYRCGQAGPFIQAESCGSSPNPNERVVISLRPDKIILSGKPVPGAVNSSAAQVKSVRFNGPRAEITVATPDLPDIHATISTWSPPVTAEVGAKIWISWDATASLRVSDE